MAANDAAGKSELEPEIRHETDPSEFDWSNPGPGWIDQRPTLGDGPGEMDLGEGWDYAAQPVGPGHNWKPQDPINMPDGNGKYPAWRTIRTRAWRRLAQNELDAREAGQSSGDTTLFELNPLADMTESQLRQTLKTGSAPRGFEIEHLYVPQRVVKLLVDAGFSASEAARLGRLGDPSNLYPTRKEIHAVLDEEAARIGSRNPSLPAALDDRTEFPLGSMDIDMLIEAISDPANRIDLSATEAGRKLRELLTIENRRLGGRSQIP